MQTYLVERTVPPTLRFEDPDTLTLHSRWAADAYRKVGAFWLGGVIIDNGMFSLVAVEQADDLARYAALPGDRGVRLHPAPRPEADRTVVCAGRGMMPAKAQPSLTPLARRLEQQGRGLLGRRRLTP